MKNTGKVTGAEVVQLYVKDVEASVVRPEKELKGFVKIALKPGETRTAQLHLTRDAFAFFSPDRNEWVVEEGEFEILLGSSSRNIRLIKKLRYPAKQSHCAGQFD